MWGAIITAALGAGQLIYGAIQKNKANKLAKDNVQPTYPIQQLYADTLGVATQNAQYGFSPDTLKSLTDIQTQNLQSGIDATLRGGGTASDVARLYSINTTANRGLMSADEQFRAQKLTNFFDQSAQMASQLGTKWRLDYYNRWKDRAVAAASMQQNANGLMAGGINTLGNAAGQFAGLASVNKIPKMEESTQETQPYTAPNQTFDWFGNTVNSPFVINNPSIPYQQPDNLDTFNHFNVNNISWPQ